MSSDVARYYDRNTRRFLVMGPGRGIYAMHRELWGPGVASAAEAADHINVIVADTIAALSMGDEPVVVDFGCGVGGTLFHLAQRLPRARLRGITVSPRQVEIAARLAMRIGCGDRCSFLLGDFQAADLDVDADVIVAVEAFAHSDRVEAFLGNAARHLRSGGALIVVDDFLAREPDELAPREKRRVDEFRGGWRVPAVRTVQRLAADAAAHGLVVDKVTDLTSLTRPGSRVRDVLTGWLSPVLVRLRLSHNPFCGNLIGGHALQVGLRDGFLRYQLLQFRKEP